MLYGGQKKQTVVGERMEGNLYGAHYAQVDTGRFDYKGHPPSRNLGHGYLTPNQCLFPTGALCSGYISSAEAVIVPLETENCHQLTTAGNQRLNNPSFMNTFALGCAHLCVLSDPCDITDPSVQIELNQIVFVVFAHPLSFAQNTQ